MTEQSQDFARAFGDALIKFLDEKGLTQTEAARRLGFGERGKARINAYCHDSPTRKRPVPQADVLYLICSELGFAFDYKGYRISAETLNGNGRRAEPTAKPPEQLSLEFNRQFYLTDQKGTVSVSFKRPPGRVELTVYLKAVS